MIKTAYLDLFNQKFNKMRRGNLVSKTNIRTQLCWMPRNCLCVSIQSQLLLAALDQSDQSEDCLPSQLLVDQPNQNCFWQLMSYQIGPSFMLI